VPLLQVVVIVVVPEPPGLITLLMGSPPLSNGPFANENSRLGDGGNVKQRPVVYTSLLYIVNRK